MTFVTGLVLAAGSSRRLGYPKQMLPLAGTTLLGATLDMAARCGFDQLLVTVGGDADIVRREVDVEGVQVVESTGHAEGCSASIVSALDVIDARADGLVVLLGDQPGIRPADVRVVIEAGRAHAVAVARYLDGRGHPFWFSRATFRDLATLHGDKAIWKLLESGPYPVVEVPLAGTVPLDVDTWDDYETLVASRS